MGGGGVGTRVQVSKREFHTYIYLDLVRVEFVGGTFYVIG